MRGYTATTFRKVLASKSPCKPLHFFDILADILYVSTSAYHAMKKHLYFSLALLFFVLLASCTRDEVSPILFGTTYYPITPGHYVIYKVKRITYNELADNELEEFERKEVIVGPFTDASGREVHRLELFARADASEPWRMDSVWTVRKEPARLVRVENNEPFVRLVFPAHDGATWNGNALNDFPAETFRAEVPDAPFSLAAGSFSRPIRVVQRQDSSIVNRDVRFEVYAEGVGMVYRKIEVYQYVNNFLSPFYGLDSITGGLFVEQTALSWGVEPPRE